MFSAIVLAACLGQVQGPPQFVLPPRNVNAWVITETAKPSKTTVTEVHTAGWHTHVCTFCGTSWSHGHESKGSQSAHTCSTCGRVNYTPSTFSRVTPAIESTTTIIRQPMRLPRADCPNGNCPYVR